MKSTESENKLFSVGSTYFFGRDDFSSPVPSDWLIDWDESYYISLSDSYFMAAVVLRKGQKFGFFMHNCGDGYGLIFYSCSVEPFTYDEIQCLSNDVCGYGFIACRCNSDWDVYCLAELGFDKESPEVRYKKLNHKPCSSFEDAQKLVFENPNYKYFDVRDKWHDISVPFPEPYYYKEHYIRNWYTPHRITKLKKNQIFVFGSNIAGQHGGGAARFAMQNFGAVWGEGVGRTGQCYAIPTMHGGIDTIGPYVHDFISYAADHPELEFLVTPIGCGIASFSEDEMAILFLDALSYGNIVLPKKFVEILERL